MNEEAKDLEQKRLKKRVVKETPKKEDTTKVPAKLDVTEQGTKKKKDGYEVRNLNLLFSGEVKTSNHHHIETIFYPNEPKWELHGIAGRLSTLERRGRDNEGYIVLGDEVSRLAAPTNAASTLSAFTVRTKAAGACRRVFQLMDRVYTNSVTIATEIGLVKERGVDNQRIKVAAGMSFVVLSQYYPAIMKP
ncbi:hypothetical protein Tco_1277480 [Tanacetum coccineum]